MRYLLALGALLLTTPASAAILTATVTGTVREGGYYAGRYPAPLNDLTGQSFTAVYTINDAIPGILVNDYDDGSVRNTGVDGGTVFGRPSPVSAVLTLAGFTINFAGKDRGYYYVYRDLANSHNDGIGLSTSSYVPRTDGQSSGILDITVYSAPQGTTSGDYRVPFSYAFQPGDSATGQINFETYTVDEAGAEQSYLYFTALFDPATISVVNASAAPEPASWAMMIGGFGLAGAAVRRRARIAYA